MFDFIKKNCFQNIKIAILHIDLFVIFGVRTFLKLIGFRMNEKLMLQKYFTLLSFFLRITYLNSIKKHT